MASLSSSLHRAFSRHREPARFGREVTDRWTEGLARSLELRRSGRVAPKRLVDVNHHDLLDDPMGVVRRIYAQFDMPLTPAAEARMRAFLAANPKGKHGQHEYALDTFGLDAQDLIRRFKAYSEYFGVRPETQGRRP